MQHNPFGNIKSHSITSIAMLNSIKDSLKNRLTELNENLKLSIMNNSNDQKRKDLDRQVRELEQLINQLDNPNINFTQLENGQSLNLDNISFKGAEIADLMGLHFDEYDQAEPAGDKTLNFSF